MSTSVMSLPNAGSGAALAAGGSSVALWTQGSVFLQLFGFLLMVITIGALAITSVNHYRLRKSGRLG